MKRLNVAALFQGLRVEGLRELGFRVWASGFAEMRGSRVEGLRFRVGLRFLFVFGWVERCLQRICCVVWGVWC